MSDIAALQNIIGYIFRDESVAQLALTHSSYSAQSNERLEFLGDSVVNLAVAQYLYANYADKSEGELSKIRAKSISTEALSNAAARLGLEQFILLGKCELRATQSNRKRIRANLFEALTGAIFVDGGYESAERFVLSALKINIDENANASLLTDYKTALQEIVQSQKNLTLEYKLISRSGTDHSPVFCFQVLINGEVAGEGYGQSKGESQRQAAKVAYEKFVKYGGGTQIAELKKD